MDWLSSKGKVGKIAAQLLKKYAKKIENMFQGILKTEAEELIKLIESVKDDIIKIISGGHIDVMNDEEMLDNTIDECKLSSLII